MKKIFVGNLAWKASEENLKPLFEAYGKVVSIRIITDQYTGKSKGFGFVEMETAEGAEKAIQELNEKPFLERNLRVSLAQERTERSDRGGERSMGGGDRSMGGGDRSMGGGGGNREYRSSDRGDRNGNSQGQKPFRPRGPSRGN